MKAHLRFLSLCLTMLCLGVVSRAQLTGTITVPSTTYPDLASVITALNTQGVGAGGATVSLTASNPQTAPATGYRLGSSTLNASLSATKPLVFNGNGNTITAGTGTGSLDAIWWLMGTDYVTINGFNLVDASTTTTTTSTAGMEYGIVLGKLNTTAPFDGCQNVTISNNSISMNKYHGISTAVLVAHITPSSSGPTTTGFATSDANSFNKFTGNTVTNASRGFFVSGTSAGTAFYDKSNQIGGTTSATGNTITVGGSTNANTLYGIMTQYDSVVTVQNNKVYIGAGQVNTTIYEYWAGIGVGTLNCLNNLFNITSNNSTSSIYGYYNSANHSDPGATRNIIGNEVTGNNTSATSNIIGALYDYYANASIINMNNNYIHDIDMGTANSTSAYWYGLYLYYNGALQANMIGNTEYNVKRLGSFYYFYASAVYQYNCPLNARINYTNNRLRKLTTGAYYLYASQLYGNYSNPARITMNYNLQDSLDVSSATGGYTYLYNDIYYTADSSEFRYDTLTNWVGSTSTSSPTYFYNWVYHYYGQKGSRVSNWYMNNWTGNAAYVYNYIGYYAQFTDSCTFSNITLGNLGYSGANITNFFGYYGTNGFARYNKVYNVNCGTNGYIYNYTAMYGSNYQCVGNSIRKQIVTGSGGIYNYMTYGCTGAKGYNNWVDSQIVGNGTMYAYYAYASGANDTLYNNRVSNLIVTTGTTNSIFGYYLQVSSANTQFHFYNNEVTNFEVPSNYGVSNMYGIYTGGTGDYKLYNNTVRISPSATNVGGNSYGATGIYFNTTGTLDLRNNIINVNVTPSANGTTVALRRSGTSGTGVPPANFLGTSNSNIYYVPNNANAYFYAEGTSTAVTNGYNLNNDPQFNTPCGLYKNFLGHDQSSFWENNLVPSGTVPAAYVPSGTSYAEKGSTATVNPTVTTDLAGVARSAPLFDIGALEFSGTPLDNAPPQIAYTPLATNTYCTTAPTLTAIIADQTGVDTSAGNKPRLYYKKSTENNAFGGGNTSSTNGWKYVEPTSINWATSTYVFNFDWSLLTSTPTTGTTIQYFLISQDVTSNKNTGANIAGFPACPTSVNLGGTNGPLNAAPAPNQFTILGTTTGFTVAASQNQMCVSGSTKLTILPTPLGTGIQWESASALAGPYSPITGATSSTYTTPVLTATTYYQAKLYCGTNLLTTTAPVTITVNNPVITSVVPASRCGYGQVTLTANTNAGTSVNWYTSATSPNPIATGTSYTTPPLGSSVTYYASAVVPKGSVEHIQLAPTAAYFAWSNPSGYGMSFNFGDTINFLSTTVYPYNSGNLYIDLVDVNGNTVKTAGPFALTGTGGSISAPVTLNLNWQNIAPGTYYMVVNSSTPSTLQLMYHYYLSGSPSFTYPILSNVTGRSKAIGGFYPTASPQVYPYYWFFFYDNVISGPCENPTRYPVAATVTPSTPITASSPNAPGVCSGASATLNATSTNTTYLYTWTPGSLTGASVTVSPTKSTKYYVNAVDPLTGCTAIDSIVMNVNAQQNPPSITPVNPTICANNAVQLTATPASPFGGTGQTGTGTSCSGGTGYPNAFNAYYPANHEQYIYRANDLTTAGVQAGPILSLAFYVCATGTSPSNYTLRLGQTTVNTMSTLIQPTQVNDGNGNTGFATVYTNGSVNPTTGWFTLNFSQPFIWDGTSNIVIDMQTQRCATCLSTGTACSSWTTYSGPSTQYSNAGFTSTIYYQYQYDCATTTFSPTAGATTSSNRPNVQWNWRRPYSINWTPNVTGLYKNYPPLSGPMTTADTNSKVWAGPTTTQVYRVVTNAQGCMSNPSNPDTVFVNPAPPVTVTPAGPQTICSGNCVTLTAPSGATMTYQWLQQVGTSSTYTVVGTSATYQACAAGTYRVRVLNLSTGCFDTSAATVVTVNALPTVNISTGTASTTFCNGGSVLITSTTNAFPALYQWYNGTTPIAGATGASYTATASGTYTLVVTNPSQCSQTSNAITVTVNTVPSTITPSGPTTFCTGGSVTLCAPTTGTGAPFTYQWYQGTTAIATTSCITASTTGNYYVVVSSASLGCTSTSSTVAVTSGTAPSAAITPASSAILCSNGTLTLSTNPSPGLTYQWNKGGVPIPAASEPTAVTANLTVGNNAATGAGSYTVTVTMSSMTTCSSTTTTPTVVTVSTAPTATFSAGGSTTFCAGGSVLLSYTGTTPVTYQWNLNGAPVATGGTSSTYTATTSGTYTVKATNSAGCTNTSAGTTVTVNPLPNVTVTQSGASNICAGGSVTLTGNSPSTISTWQWKVNGSPVVPAATASSYAANATGNYTVTATDGNGCQGTSTPVAVIVNPLPNATTTPSTNQTICQGSTLTMSTPFNTAYTYKWKNASGYIALATQSSYTTGTAGSYSVEITNTVTGCQATSNPIVLTVTPPPAASVTRATGAGAICSNDSVKLLANIGGGLTYQWNYNGVPVAGATDTMLYVKTQGTYTVTVFNGSCSATSPGMLIQVNPSPAAFITYNNNLAFCEGSAVVLTANSGAGLAYQWFVNDTATTNTSNAFVANTTGVYKLTTKNGFGCTSTSDTLHVTVYPAPDPQIVRSGSDGTILSTAQAYASYQWFLNNSAIGGATSQTYTATQNGAYKVRVTDSNGCENFSKLIFIQNVGIIPTPVSAAIKVFPNPTSGILHIDAPVKVQLNLRDVTGKTVAEAAEVKEMDITKVASGMYLLYISDMNGKTLRIDKVTKTDN